MLKERMPEGVCGGIEVMMPTELRTASSEGLPHRKRGAPPCLAPLHLPEGRRAPAAPPVFLPCSETGLPGSPTLVPMHRDAVCLSERQPVPPN